jgi:hypothetical protein
MHLIGFEFNGIARIVIFRRRKVLRLPFRRVPSGAIRNTSRSSDRYAARPSRNNIGIFIKQKGD